MYELIHIGLGVGDLFLGVLGGYYGVTTIMKLRKSPEMLSQRKIWLPMLVGAMLFMLGGPIHIIEHTLATFVSEELELLHEVLMIVGLAFFVIGILRYAQLQREYDKVKQVGLKLIQAESQFQTEPEQGA